MTVPTNTRAEVEADARPMLAASWSDVDRAIHEQEAQGQAQLVASTVLPTNMGNGRTALSAFGVVFGGEVSGDPLFQHATLPAGWQKRPTDHELWSDLVDDRNRIRARIFYKAAWYDRESFLRVCCRLNVEKEPEGGWDNRSAGRWVAFVKDADGGIVYRTPVEPEQQPYDGTSQRVYQQAEAWLTAHYPDCQDTQAYWDADIPHLPEIGAKSNG